MACDTCVVAVTSTITNVISIMMSVLLIATPARASAQGLPTKYLSTISGTLWHRLLAIIGRDREESPLFSSPFVR